jgi:hypothetical protein
VATGRGLRLVQVRVSHQLEADTLTISRVYQLHDKCACAHNSKTLPAKKGKQEAFGFMFM